MHKYEATTKFANFLVHFFFLAQVFALLSRFASFWFVVLLVLWCRNISASVISDVPLSRENHIHRMNKIGVALNNKTTVTYFI